MIIGWDGNDRYRQFNNSVYVLVLMSINDFHTSCHALCSSAKVEYLSIAESKTAS